MKSVDLTSLIVLVAVLAGCASSSLDNALYSKTLETQIAVDDYLLSGWIPIDIADVNDGSGLNQEIGTDSSVVDSLENTQQGDQPTCPDEITFVSKQTISDIDIISSSDYTVGLPAGSSLRDVVSLAVEYSFTDLRSLGVENVQLPSEQVTSIVPRVIPLAEESQTVEQLISIDNRIPLRISVRFLIPPDQENEHIFSLSYIFESGNVNIANSPPVVLTLN